MQRVNSAKSEKFFFSGTALMVAGVSGEEGHACGNTYPDICTDDQVCESLAPCDMNTCPRSGPSVCSAIQGSKCLKRYHNQCQFEVALCKNHGKGMHKH